MAARVVRKSELGRVLDVLIAHGFPPTACDLLRGGDVRLHLTPPETVAPDARLSDEEAKAWDAALK